VAACCIRVASDRHGYVRARVRSSHQKSMTMFPHSLIQILNTLENDSSERGLSA
jgi:hypothetical protein